MTDLINRTWPDWQVTAELGRGSFGTVYKAVRSEYGITMTSAIKVITIPKGDVELKQMRAEGKTLENITTHYEGVVKSCIREIEILQTLKNNEHIVKIEDFKVIRHEGEVKWDILIRMELLKSLDDYLAEKYNSGSRPAQIIDEYQVKQLGIDICDALIECEKHHIIHRDIKLGNVFAAEDPMTHEVKFKLGDFGISKMIDEAADLTTRTGTPTYMAPEIWHGRKYNSTVDIYALGIMLYWLMNDRQMPFYTADSGLTRDEAFLLRMNGEPLPAPVKASPGFAAVILKACSYAPENRYQSAAEMLRCIEDGTVVLPAEETMRTGKTSLASEKTMLVSRQTGKQKNISGKRFVAIGIGAAAVLCAAGLIAMRYMARDTAHKGAAQQAVQQSDTAVSNSLPETPWMRAYYEYISEECGALSPEKLGTVSCRMFYVDADQVPELLIDYGNTADGAEICTYYEGQVSSQNIDSASLACADGVLRFSYSNTGYTHQEIYDLNNGSFHLKAAGEYKDEGTDDSSKWSAFRWNQEKMDLAAYQQRMKDAFNEPASVNIADLPNDGDSKVRAYADMLEYLSSRPDGPVIPSAKSFRESSVWNGHTYVYIDRKINWHEAETFCRLMGGHLADILSAEEDAAIYSYITGVCDGSAYFGLSDYDQEGTFTWCTGEPFTYANWNKSEPNGQDEYEDYVMYYSHYTDGTWNDDDYRKDVAGYICEWDLK